LLSYSNTKSYLENPEGREKREARLSIMFQKQKGLAMKCGNPSKIYMIENKLVSITLGAEGQRKKRGKKWA
jgi:hypothetical protein